MSLLLAASSLAALAPSPLLRTAPRLIAHRAPAPLLASAAAAHRASVAAAAAAKTAKLSAATSLLPRSSALFGALLPALTVVALCLVGLVPTGLRGFWGPRLKLQRRIFTGCMMGILVTLWIFSGTWAFIGVFAAMAVVAENEYYAMARANGVFPTWKLGTLGSVAMYVAACSNNALIRDAMFPLTGVVTIVYLLLRQERSTPPTTMNDVSTTFMGIYYFGYMPSFWVRLRCLGPLPPARVLRLFTPAGAAALTGGPLAAAVAARADFFTKGAVIAWWTMLSIVAADVGAYFVGKQYGRTPLISRISPGKTWEGLLGGCVAATFVSVSGAVLMRWPWAAVSGALYGLTCAVMALIGDLTVSLLKRSAGVKDTGRLLPGHGGLLDRLDSYLLVAAPAYFFVKVLLPAFARLPHPASWPSPRELGAVAVLAIAAAATALATVVQALSAQTECLSEAAAAELPADEQPDCVLLDSED